LTPPRRRTLVWFRGKDLRLADHAPLADAIEGGEVIPLFVLDPFFFAPDRARRLPHRIQFLLDALRELEAAIARRGSRLVVVEGRSVDVVPRLARKWKVDRVVGHRWTEPFGRERDRRVSESLAVPFDLYEGETLAAAGTIRTAAGRPFAVFTQFARAFARDVRIDDPLAAASRLPPLPADVRDRSVPVPSCEDIDVPRNAAVIAGGERAARARLRRFLRGPAATYDGGRNRLDAAGTSRLSADLKFGTISARSVWTEVLGALRETRPGRAFRNQLVWREFTHATLWDRPKLLSEPFRESFSSFPWQVEEEALARWAQGATGYPVIDAASRQLIAEGFVPNRARMISASFLAKHLLVDYHLGEAHYLRWLVDGDWAQNNAGWQWSAGCGCDAQPWFRVFNPVLQGEKFDPEGAWVRRFVPEIARLPAGFIHRPWEAPASVLEDAGVRLGVTYPRPIVDHQAARERFLALARRHLRR
jgi:deoxyribodipyrimidine photo-lyase